MTEEQEFCARFKKECQELRSRKIMLYGVGEKTQFLLKNVKNFDFQGILDSQSEGEYLYGTKVFPLQEVVDRKCVIIIVARDHIVPIIYNRICTFCEENCIEVYDVHGNRLPYEEMESVTEQLEYWNLNEKSIRKCLTPYPIISFDIFDTLIQRNVLDLKDMYRLMEMQKMVPEKFSEYRRKAEQECMEVYSIEDIYDKIEKLSGWSRDVLGKCLNAELEMEKRVLNPKKEMIDLMQWAETCGKQIYLVSDMYWSRETITEMLDKAGVSGYQQILVSCVEGKSKKRGTLFDTLKRVVGTDQIVHIGDNRYDDIRMARKKGLEAVQIMSAYELLMVSDMKELLNKANILQDRVILGMVTTKLFSNPFTLYRHKGQVYIKDSNTFAYCLLCPVIYKGNLQIKNKILLDACAEFQDDLNRLCGIATVDVSAEFKKALMDWTQEHLQRFTPECVGLLQLIR